MLIWQWYIYGNIVMLLELSWSWQHGWNRWCPHGNYRAGTRRHYLHPNRSESIIVYMHMVIDKDTWVPLIVVSDCCRISIFLSRALSDRSSVSICSLSSSSLLSCLRLSIVFSSWCWALRWWVILFSNEEIFDKYSLSLAASTVLNLSKWVNRRINYFTSNIPQLHDLALQMGFLFGIEIYSHLDFCSALNLSSSCICLLSHSCSNANCSSSFWSLSLFTVASSSYIFSLRAAICSSEAELVLDAFSFNSSCSLQVQRYPHVA